MSLILKFMFLFRNYHELTNEADFYDLDQMSDFLKAEKDLNRVLGESNPRPSPEFISMDMPPASSPETMDVNYAPLKEGNDESSDYTGDATESSPITASQEEDLLMDFTPLPEIHNTSQEGENPVVADSFMAPLQLARDVTLPTHLRDFAANIDMEGLHTIFTRAMLADMYDALQGERARSSKRQTSGSVDVFDDILQIDFDMQDAVSETSDKSHELKQPPDQRQTMSMRVLPFTHISSVTTTTSTSTTTSAPVEVIASPTSEASPEYACISYDCILDDFLCGF